MESLFDDRLRADCARLARRVQRIPDDAVEQRMLEHPGALFEIALQRTIDTAQIQVGRDGGKQTQQCRRQNGATDWVDEREPFDDGVWHHWFPSSATTPILRPSKHGPFQRDSPDARAAAVVAL
ncbi:MAG TPA: hypothetical protein VHB97_20050 [Polyangia bacterium]|nr:hypothetical protein [Polyangia bacterium]